MAAPVATKVGAATDSAGSSTVITLTEAVSAGQSIVVVYGNQNGRNISSVSDSAGNTYVERVDRVQDNQGVTIWDCLNPSALSVGQTVTLFLGALNTAARAAVYKLNATCTYVASSAGNNGGNDGSPTVNTGASIPADSLVFGILNFRQNPQTITAPSGWTEVDTVGGGNSTYKQYTLPVTSSPGVKTMNPDVGGEAQDWAIGVAAYSSPASGGATGSITGTDGADSASLSGDVLVQGSAAGIDGPDVAAFAGDVLVQGILDATEGADASAFTGSTALFGSLSGTEGADVGGLSGNVLITGTLSGPEGADAGGLSGDVLVQGSMTATEPADSAVFSGSGALSISGALTGTDGADAAAVTGLVLVSGQVSGVEGADGSSAAGKVLAQGAFAATEGADTAAVSGNVIAFTPLSGALTGTEGADTPAFAGKVLVFGALAEVDGADSGAITGKVVVSVSLEVTDGADGLEFTSFSLVFPTDPNCISIVGAVSRMADVVAANRNADVAEIQRTSTVSR